MNINAIIVDDSQQSIDALKASLELYTPIVSVLDTANDLEKAEVLLSDSDIDVAFLDIEMHEQKTIFDLLEQRSQSGPIPFEVIFVTGRSESDYTLKAIEMMALGYILKPIDGKKLAQAVERVRERITLKIQQDQLNHMLAMIRSQNQSQSLSIHLSKGDIKIVNLSEIEYITGDGPISEFHLTSTSVKSVKGLGHYARILDGHSDIHKFSQSLIVNLNHMDRFASKDLEVRMKNGKMLEASRRGAQAFRGRA